jgi:hypothetical protein
MKKERFSFFFFYLIPMTLTSVLINVLIDLLTTGDVRFGWARVIAGGAALSAFFSWWNSRENKGG